MNDNPERASSRALPLLFVGVVFLLATGRWGSYLHPPRVPFYIGDVIVLAAVAQAFLRWRRKQVTPFSLRSAPPVLNLALALLVWALLRTVTRTALPLVAVRDFAPYGYAVAVPLAFLVPARTSQSTRAWIYGALTFHAAWYLAETSGLIDSNTTWRLGPSATLFSTRPDFDAAVFGIAIAFAVHQFASGPRPSSRLRQAGMLAFIGVNAVPLGTQHSRSGLLSAFVTVGVVLVTWLRPGARVAKGHGWAKRGGVVTVAAMAALMALLFTLPGQRLMQGFGSGPNGDARATSGARVAVHEGLTHWILHSPVRIAVGIGYGPNVLARSNTAQYLEGITYEKVRSPHDYLLGTWARLGLIGAAMVGALMLAAAALAARELTTSTGAADVLAALVVIAIPVVAFLGVVMESPFGAIPYFWAVGQLCATSRIRVGRVAETGSPGGSAGAQA
jgi:hypothetical protein